MEVQSELGRVKSTALLSMRVVGPIWTLPDAVFVKVTDPQALDPASTACSPQSRRLTLALRLGWAAEAADTGSASAATAAAA